jgi:hypothetical protein
MGKWRLKHAEATALQSLWLCSPVSGFYSQQRRPACRIGRRNGLCGDAPKAWKPLCSGAGCVLFPPTLLFFLKLTPVGKSFIGRILKAEICIQKQSVIFRVECAWQAIPNVPCAFINTGMQRRPGPSHLRLRADPTQWWSVREAGSGSKRINESEIGNQEEASF